MSFLKHRGYLLSLVALGAVLAFAACGSDNEKTSGTASPGGGAGERIQGGTLTVQSLGSQSLDPHFSNFAQDIGYLANSPLHTPPRHEVIVVRRHFQDC